VRHKEQLGIVIGIMWGVGINMGLGSYWEVGIKLAVVLFVIGLPLTYFIMPFIVSLSPAMMLPISGAYIIVVGGLAFVWKGGMLPKWILKKGFSLKGK